MYAHTSVSAIMVDSRIHWRHIGDGNDWVSPVYVMNVASGKSDGSKSVPAQQRIIKAGVWSAKGGPWTVTDSNIQAPSGDQHDYLSWAPYHWPDCNWCTSKGDNAPKDSGQDPNADNAPQSSSTSSGPLSVQTVLPSTLPNWTPGQDGLTGMGLINGVLGPVEAGLATVVGAGSGLLEPVLGPVFRRDEGNEGGPSAESPLQDRDANPQHLLATSMWMDPNGWVDTNSATLEVPTPTTPPMLQPIWTAAPMPTATPLGAAPLAVPSISVPGSPTAAKSASATQTGSRTANSIQDGSTPASNGSGKNKGKSAGGGGEKSSSCTPSKTSMQPSASEFESIEYSVAESDRPPPRIAAQPGRRAPTKSETAK